MESIYKKLMATMTFASMLFVLCSCYFTKSFDEFIVENVTVENENEYTSAQELAFARIEGVTFVPFVKAIDDGPPTYGIFLSAYANEVPENIVLKKYVVTVEDTVIFGKEETQSFLLELNENGIFQKTIQVGTFTEEEYLATKHGFKFDLTFQVEVTKGGQVFTKDIVFNMKVKGGGWNPVWPT